MAEKVLENRVCKACGADVRPQALFCYNCGASVAPDVGESNGASGAASSSWRSAGGETFNENNREIETKAKKKKSKRETLRPIEKPTVALEGNFSSPSPPPAVAADADEQTKLKTAAALRKSVKASPAATKKKTIEVVWEEPDSNAPNIWFIVAALVLTLFAAGILFAALYLK
jgi:hypothetical protein